MNSNLFTITKKCVRTKARAGQLLTAHGLIETPVFMPVATQGSVKTVSNDDLISAGVELFISNAYHLYLRPGLDVINRFNGLHGFTGWTKGITTDSGGFQLYSLAKLRKISAEGVEFQSHIDGSAHFFSPEKVIDIQSQLGADIIMCFDECPPYPSSYEYAQKSMELTLEWAKRCKSRFNQVRNKQQFLFGIVQGNTFHDLREQSLARTVEFDFDGYSIGGLSVGEPKDVMYELIERYVNKLPEPKPRYTMGIGLPEDIWYCVEHGVDMFDCVIPSRNGRNGQAFTTYGKVNIKNAEYRTDQGPLDPDCECSACRRYTRAYLHHLYHSGELLALRLLTLHNIFFIIKLTKIIRASIKQDNFLAEKEQFLKKYNSLKGPNGDL
jgi:queuine tRNA-ribosyltransferase